MRGRASTSRPSTSTFERRMTSSTVHHARRAARIAAHTFALLAVGGAALVAQAQAPTMGCDAAGIGAAPLTADGPPVSILAVSREMAGTVPYCLVKVLVPQAINIWVGLPLDGAWNGRWQSVGGGGYAGRRRARSAPIQPSRAGPAQAARTTPRASSARLVPSSAGLEHAGTVATDCNRGLVR